MQKIDYGDINKFLVSIGLILICLAILIPYFYLKENFGLYIDQATFEKFQEPIQKIITSKQKIIIIIQKIIPWASLALFLIGVTSSAVGLKRWLKRQAKIDEKFDKEIQILDFKIESLTPEETEEKARKEVREIEAEEEIEPISKPQHTTRTTYRDYIEIEKRITNVFLKYKSNNFEILSQQRLGNKFEIDLLLRAKPKKYSDRIVEIKYFRNRFHFSIINKALHQLNTYISYYKNVAQKQAIPVLLIIYNKKAISPEMIQKYNDKIKENSFGVPNHNRLKVEFIEEQEIENFDVQKILKR